MDTDYVWVKRTVIEKIKIPEGNTKCPSCNGRGEIRLCYGQPWDRGQFRDCPRCGGKGYVLKDLEKEHQKIRDKGEERQLL